MNKFHLIDGMRLGSSSDNTELKEEMDQFIKAKLGKILYFKDSESYSTKITKAMTK